jgi:hypothetical protein
MTKVAPMRFAVLYHGPKKSDGDLFKSVTVPGRPDPLEFKAGPDYEAPYAYATEMEARHIAARLNSDNLFSFPMGLRNPDDKDDLWARIAELEKRVAALEGAEPAEPKRRGRKPTEAEVA